MAAKGELVLTKRALNRALLARQFLLKREKLSAIDVVQKLCGMQAQIPRPPFIGLWTRLTKFEPDDLLTLARSKKLVRGTTMRGTIHLHTVADYLHFRPLLSEFLAKGAWTVSGKKLGDIDVQPLYTLGREFFSKNAAPFDEMRAAIEAKFPRYDVRAAAYVIRMGIPLVMVPTDDDRWGWPGNAGFTLAESFLGRPIPPAPSLDAMVLRYIEAFGPATPADAQTWCGIRGMKDVFERLRPKLVTFRDERKRELFDVPNAPRPHEDTPAPVRFLPEYDNAALSHDDRSRIIAKEHHRKLVLKNLTVVGGFTVDGFISGTWRIEPKAKAPTMTLRPFWKLTKKETASVEAEGDSLFRFLAPEATKRRFTYA